MFTDYELRCRFLQSHHASQARYTRERLDRAHANHLDSLEDGGPGLGRGWWEALAFEQRKAARIWRELAEMRGIK